MHFRRGTSFRGIEDAEYVPKFDYRNLLNPFFIALFKKIVKGIKIQKKIELIKYSKRNKSRYQPGTKIAIYISSAALTVSREFQCLPAKTFQMSIYLVLPSTNLAKSMKKKFE